MKCNKYLTHMENKNIKILITGVAGLLGTHLSRHLLNKGYEVIGIDNLSGGYVDFIDDRVKFYKFDLLKTKMIDFVFDKHKIDYVYHLAAYAAEGLSPFIRNFNYKNNVLCSVNIINSCIKHDVKKIIFTSSMSVYGYGAPPFNEEHLPSPIDPYGIAKYTIEQDLKQAYEQFGLKYTIIRPHNVIGIYQNIWDRYRNVIGIWINNVIKNNPILIYGDGEQKRAFSDIKFYMKPFEVVMYEHDNEIFNIGSDLDIKLNDVAKIVSSIGKKHGYNPTIQHVEPRHEVKNAYCEHKKAIEYLNFKDETNLEKIIGEMFLWAKEQPNRRIKKMKYEITKNIYSYWKYE